MWYTPDPLLAKDLWSPSWAGETPVQDAQRRMAYMDRIRSEGQSVTFWDDLNKLISPTTDDTTAEAPTSDPSAGVTAPILAALGDKMPDVLHDDQATNNLIRVTASFARAEEVVAKSRIAAEGVRQEKVIRAAGEQRVRIFRELWKIALLALCAVVVLGLAGLVFKLVPGMGFAKAGAWVKLATSGGGAGTLALLVRFRSKVYTFPALLVDKWRKWRARRQERKSIVPATSSVEQSPPAAGPSATP